MSPTLDFNDSELWTVQSTLKERYGQDVDMQQGDTDVRLSRHTTDMTHCPTLYWRAEDGCHLLFAAPVLRNTTIWPSVS